MRKTAKRSDVDMRPEYDFKGAVRGKYAKRCAEGTNLVLLSPDVARVFRDSVAVNEALRTLMRINSPKRKKVAA